MILHLPPPIHGAAIMGKYMIDSNIINQAFEVDHVNLSTSRSLTDIGKGSLKKLKNSIGLVRKVAAALRRKNYDLCYVTLTSSSSGFYKDLLIVLTLKLASKKIVYHFHNKGVSSRQSRWIDNLLYRFAFKGTKSILLSPSLYVDVKKYVKVENVFYCANGIPARLPTVNTIAEKCVDKSKPCRLLFLSHMMVQKGVVTLLDACEIMQKRKLKFECHFVGAWMDISVDNFSRMVHQRGLGDILFAHGPKFDQEKCSFYESSDIFVFPTLNECFGLVLLEAMSFGLPIVATGEGAIPDIVSNEKTGFIVEKNNCQSLADKLEILISNSELRTQFGNEGRRRFTDHFTIDKFERKMMEILIKTTTLKTHPVRV